MIQQRLSNYKIIFPPSKLTRSTLELDQTKGPPACYPQTTQNALKSPRPTVRCTAAMQELNLNAMRGSSSLAGPLFKPETGEEQCGRRLSRSTEVDPWPGFRLLTDTERGEKSASNANLSCSLRTELHDVVPPFGSDPRRNTGSVAGLLLHHQETGESIFNGLRKRIFYRC